MSLIRSEKYGVLVPEKTLLPYSYLWDQWDTLSTFAWAVFVHMWTTIILRPPFWTINHCASTWSPMEPQPFNFSQHQNIVIVASKCVPYVQKNVLHIVVYHWRICYKNSYCSIAQKASWLPHVWLVVCIEVGAPLFHKHRFVNERHKQIQETHSN